MNELLEWSIVNRDPDTVAESTESKPIEKKWVDALLGPGETNVERMERTLKAIVERVNSTRLSDLAPRDSSKPRTSDTDTSTEGDFLADQLEELAEDVLDIDSANALVGSEGFDTLLSLVGDEHVLYVRANALSVIGSAIQNNLSALAVLAQQKQSFCASIFNVMVERSPLLIRRGLFVLSSIAVTDQWAEELIKGELFTMLVSVSERFASDSRVLDRLLFFVHTFIQRFPKYAREVDKLITIILKVFLETRQVEHETRSQLLETTLRLVDTWLHTTPIESTKALKRNDPAFFCELEPLGDAKLANCHGCTLCRLVHTNLQSTEGNEDPLVDLVKSIMKTYRAARKGQDNTD